ncbi:hypothetical protein OEA41_006510 [Lepraria neglecta]|uniref:Uncharacterized protein n=1 Tax=Lepraria neglecta TaxID=209136 RepID=A0AAD9Z914_9LECA|nr:hypothetical protein OEA41_006510 [Lepraria neglecta]
MHMGEKGIAVAGTTIYVITGPSGVVDHANATENMDAFGPGYGNSVTTLWPQIYQAKDHIKLGGFARGSGSTPTLLGHEYLAVTDNANDQIGVLVYRQSPQPHQNTLVCRVPVFEPGASACDVGGIGHADGRGGYSAMVLNDYNAPPLHLTATDINGEFNNLTQMAPGAVRVDATPDSSGCSVG